MLAAMLVLTLAAAPASDRPRILVLKVKAEHGLPQGTANLLGEILVRDIHRSGRYEAIAVSDLAAMLDVEQQKRLVGCEDESCIAEVGNALGAELVLEASVGTIGTSRVLAIKVIEARRAAVKGRETETVHDDEGLIGAAHRLVARLLDLPAPPVAESGPAPGWFVLGGGALLVGAGAVLGLLALGDYHDFEQAPFDDGLGDSARTKALVADGFYLTGALAIAGGVAWLFLDGAPASAEP